MMNLGYINRHKTKPNPSNTTDFRTVHTSAFIIVHNCPTPHSMTSAFIIVHHTTCSSSDYLSSPDNAHSSGAVQWRKRSARQQPRLLVHSAIYLNSENLHLNGARLATVNETPHGRRSHFGGFLSTAYSATSAVCCGSG